MVRAPFAKLSVISRIVNRPARPQHTTNRQEECCDLGDEPAEPQDAADEDQHGKAEDRKDCLVTDGEDNRRSPYRSADQHVARHPVRDMD